MVIQSLLYLLFTHSILANFTMDCTGRTMFGIDVDSQGEPENDFVKNCKEIMNMGVGRLSVLIACK